MGLRREAYRCRGTGAGCAKELHGSWRLQDEMLRAGSSARGLSDMEIIIKRQCTDTATDCYRLAAGRG